MKVEIEASDLPDGCEYTGEYRIVREGEFYESNGKVVLSRTDHRSNIPHLIVRCDSQEFKKRALQERLAKVQSEALALSDQLKDFGG